MSRRDDAKQETRHRLLTAAREVVAEQGAAALSLRDVARRAGVVPSAVYRHMESRDALLSELLVESYGSLADALEGRSREGWAATAGALRTWARERPHEFQLLYGTPVPGYSAPERTVPEAARIARAFLHARAGTDTSDQTLRTREVRSGSTDVNARPSAAEAENVPAGTLLRSDADAALLAQLEAPAGQLGADAVLRAVREFRVR